MRGDARTHKVTKSVGSYCATDQTQSTQVCSSQKKINFVQSIHHCIAFNTNMADYRTAFDAETYLVMDDKYHDTNSDDKTLLEYRQKPFHKFWSNFKADVSRGTSGVRCLEFGGGPVIRNLISASPKVDRIVFAEYLEGNRQAVISWLAGNSKAHDHSSLIKYVVHDLEGDCSPDAVSKREKDLRQKIQSVVSCDVTANPIVDLEPIDLGKPFDVVSTSLCLEGVASSEEHYKSCVAKLCKFLKPSGHLIMFGVLNESFYVVGDAKFHHFTVTQSVIQDALQEAGIRVVEKEIFDLPPFNSQYGDAQEEFYIIGEKSDVADD